MLLSQKSPPAPPLPPRCPLSSSRHTHRHTYPISWPLQPYWHLSVHAWGSLRIVGASVKPDIWRPLAAHCWTYVPLPSLWGNQQPVWSLVQIHSGYVSSLWLCDQHSRPYIQFLTGRRTDWRRWGLLWPQEPLKEEHKPSLAYCHSALSGEMHCIIGAIVLRDKLAMLTWASKFSSTPSSAFSNLTLDSAWISSTFSWGVLSSDFSAKTRCLGRPSLYEISNEHNIVTSPLILSQEWPVPDVLAIDHRLLPWILCMS